MDTAVTDVPPWKLRVEAQSDALTLSFSPADSRAVKREQEPQPVDFPALLQLFLHRADVFSVSGSEVLNQHVYNSCNLSACRNRLGNKIFPLHQI